MTTADILDAGAVAQLLGVRKGTVAQWGQRGIFLDPAGHVSRSPYWLRDDVVRWAQNTGRSTDSRPETPQERPEAPETPEAPQQSPEAVAARETPPERHGAPSERVCVACNGTTGSEWLRHPRTGQYRHKGKCPAPEWL